MVVDTTRLAWIDTLNLDRGAHPEGPDTGACVMEAVAYVAGEDWSDHPACASPVLGAFLRTWNDALDPDTRQRLKPYIPRIVGTAGDQAADERRAWMATDWLVRSCAPAFLELAGLAEDAERFRALPELTSTTVAKQAQPTLDAGRKSAAAAGAAARAAARATAWAAVGAVAWDAAWDAAGAAAGAAARDAARATAWAAVGAVAWAVAWDAAWDAAGAAAWAAAWDAAGDALKPTVTTLQTSAFDLLERMLFAGRPARREAA